MKSINFQRDWLSLLFTVICIPTINSIANGQNAHPSPESQMPHAMGSVTPSTVYINCDYIQPFQEGLAIVGKGNSQAVINSKGEFVVPYNKFRLVRHSDAFGVVPEGFVNGSCVVQGLNNEGYGIIDKHGDIIVPCENTIAFPFDSYGLAVIAKQGKYYFVDRKNTGIEVSGAFRKFQQPDIGVIFNPSALSIVTSQGIVDRVFTKNGVSIGMSDNGYAVFDINGNIKNDNYFPTARHFSNGLAAVCKPNEFGESKWGFVNEAGEIAIPLKFTNEPGDFSEGLSLVIPVDQSEFHYAYIDRTGKVVLTIKENLEGHSLGSSRLPLPTSPWSRSQFADMGRFQGDYAFIPYRYTNSRPFLLIDKTGKSQMQYLDAMIGGSTKMGDYIYQNSDYMLSDGQVLLPRGGLLDLKNHFTIPAGIFNEISCFDPNSDLARARKNDITGYINRQGEFVIAIAKPKSKW